MTNSFGISFSLYHKSEHKHMPTDLRK